MSEPAVETFEITSMDGELQALDIAMTAIRRRVDRGEMPRLAPLRIASYLSDWAEDYVRSTDLTGANR